MPVCKSSAFISFPILLILAAFSQFGCQSQTERYVTREEFDKALRWAPTEIMADDSHDNNRHARIDALAKEIVAAESVGQRAAALLAASDNAVPEFAKTLEAIDLAYSVVLMNLRNSETTAYKAQRLKRNSAQLANCLDMEQGPFENTGRTLDLAITGDGFFRVKIMDGVSDGTAYTRNGNFFRNLDGDLVLGVGDRYKLLPAINIPGDATDISINREGLIEYIKAGQHTKTIAGQIQLAYFIDPHQLNLLGGSLFTETEQSGKPIFGRPGEKALGTVLQNFLEGSNVDLFREGVRLRFLNNWRATLLQAVHDPSQHQHAGRPNAGEPEHADEHVAGTD